MGIYFGDLTVGGDNNNSMFPTIKSFVLNTNNWDLNLFTQRIEVEGVMADPLKQIITVSPHFNSREEYLDNGIQCISQEENALIFKSNSLPTSNLSIYISIQNAK